MGISPVAVRVLEFRGKQAHRIDPLIGRDAPNQIHVESPSMKTPGPGATQQSTLFRLKCRGL
jgi:hypothetical protein